MTPYYPLLAVLGVLLVFGIMTCGFFEVGGVK